MNQPLLDVGSTPSNGWSGGSGSTHGAPTAAVAPTPPTGGADAAGATRPVPWTPPPAVKTISIFLSKVEPFESVAIADK